MPNLTAPEVLTAQHQLGAFDCGEEPLNAFLKSHALDKQNAMLSRTYVVNSGGVVVGYYTLAHTFTLQSETPKNWGAGCPLPFRQC